MRDRPDSAFYCAPQLSPDETFAAIEAALKTAIIRARETYSAQRFVMSGGFLLSVHRSIFGPPLFAEWQGAGRFREAHETTEFSVPVWRDRHWVMRTVHGSKPELVGMDLSFVFSGWNGFWEDHATRRDAVPLSDAALAVSKLYTGVLRVHPFCDGNHRASFVTCAAALSSLGLPLIDWESDEELRAHDRAVGAAIDPGQDDPGLFARLLEDRLNAARGTQP